MDRFQLLLSRAILKEVLSVLAYPRFRLTDAETRALLEEELIRGIKVCGNDAGRFWLKSSFLSTIRIFGSRPFARPINRTDDYFPTGQ